ncbi:MAG: hypothetical protein M1824_005055 [Vezdaea acicularis]|nr:MAG: hypothetical protein M1824_005055 [Vezdaea acicularis]
MVLPSFDKAFPHVTDTSIYYPPYSLGTAPTLVYFITGNPGVVAYYDKFLKSLTELLRKDSIEFSRQNNTFPRYGFSILATSLAGFETESSNFTHVLEAKRPFSLEEQIELCELRLESFLRMPDDLSEWQNLPPKNVILVGHSVGAYILLELLRRRRARIPNETAGPDIIGGILLFPTVTWIAKSPNGRMFSWLFSFTGFASIVGALARGFSSLLPFFLLWRFVRALTWMPPATARTTVTFLRSLGGVKQALWMAKDEMKTITEDKWDRGLWACRDTKLLFYFGENDHWVDNNMRDDLIKSRRAEEQEWPKMVIDEQRVSHGFCISHSDVVAKVVAHWVGKIANE